MDLTHLPMKQKMAILSGALIALFLAALDQTVVGTALPKIVSDLGGIGQLSWVVTIYLLTSTVTVPIAGKLSDVYGRKPLLLIGAVIFVGGSMAAGTSQTIEQLIIFRGIQGIGAGAIMANTFTVVADLFSPADRGKWLGVFGAVFGLSSVAGPLVGGFLTDTLSWRYTFFVNLPVGILAFALITSAMPSIKNTVKKAIDYIGAVFLALTLIMTMLILTWGGDIYAWGSLQILLLAAGAAITLTAFLITETRAEDPILPLDLFKNRNIAVPIGVAFFSGVAMFASIVYIPLFAQVVQGKSATSSGYILIPFVFGIVIGSTITGRLTSSLGKVKIFGVIGTIVITAGMLILSQIQVGTSDIQFMAMMITPGIGLGMVLAAFNLAGQNAVPHSRVGVATSSMQLFRQMGATMGLATLGSIFNSGLEQRIRAEIDPEVAREIGPELLNRLIDPQLIANAEANRAATASLPPELLLSVESLLDSMRVGLANMISYEFMVAAGFVGVSILVGIWLKETPLRPDNVEKTKKAS